MFLVYHLRRSNCSLPLVTRIGRVARMETVLQGRMGCVFVRCLHSLALHTRVLCARQWGLCTWRTQAFSRGGGDKQSNSCTGGVLACSEHAALEKWLLTLVYVRGDSFRTRSSAEPLEDLQLEPLAGSKAAFLSAS